MNKLYFLLGAKDPEMDMMEKLLEKIGMPFAYATVGGVRVHAGNAYKAYPVVVLDGHRLVLVECEPANIADFPDFIRIDHHRPGDPGYDLGPADFWKASSIGQLHETLLREPTWEAIVMAAHDHCFQAALNNECGDVTAEEVLSLKISEIAKSARVTEDEVRDSIDAYAFELQYSPKMVIGSEFVHDLRRFDLGVGYSLKLLTAQVAAAMSGHGALLRHRHETNGPDVWSLRGYIAPETVVAFMETWAPAHGLVRIHGNPQRWYAGGYVVSK